MRRHGISQQTFYRWKAKYGGVEVSGAQRLKALEDESRRLKRLVPSGGEGARKRPRCQLETRNRALVSELR